MDQVVTGGETFYRNPTVKTSMKLTSRQTCHRKMTRGGPWEKKKMYFGFKHTINPWTPKQDSEEKFVKSNATPVVISLLCKV